MVGSIAFLRPFHVPKTAFIRDITFFTAAVIVLVVVLRDGHLTLFESATMVALYALYVVVVIAMNVLARRRRVPDTPGELDHGGWKSLPGSGSLSPLTNNGGGHAPSFERPTSLHLPSPHREEPPYESDEGSSTGSLTPTGIPRSRRRSRSRSRSHPQAHQHQHQHPHQHQHHQHLHMHLQGLSTPNDYPETPRANFSLLGAIEFRDVVNSLKREQELSGSRAPSPSRSPYTAAERGDYFSATPGQAQGNGHRRSVSHAAARRSSTQYRSRAISHVVHPGSMATFTMPPVVDDAVSPKRASPTRTTSAPGPVSPGSGSGSRSGYGRGPGDHSPRKHQTDPTSDSSLSPDSATATNMAMGISPSSENPWTFQSGNPPKPSLPKLSIPEPLLPPKRRSGHGTTPSIAVVDPSGHVEEPIFSPPRDGASPPIRLNTLTSGPNGVEPTTQESRFKIRRRIRKTLRVLFPSLQSLRHKSHFGKILSIFSVPAIFVLTLTLPVVDDGNREEGAGAIALPEGEDEPLVPDSENRHPSDFGEEEEDEDDDDPYLRPDVGEGLHQLVEGGFSPLHSPLGRIHHSARRFEESLHDDDEDEEGDEEITKELIEEMEEEEALHFNKSLCAAQCVLGPTFCSYIVFGRFSLHPSLAFVPLFSDPFLSFLHFE